MSLTKTPFYKTNVLYSVTINPNNRCQGTIKGGAHSRLVDVKTQVWNVLNKHPDIKYLLHLDISEPLNLNNNFPRVHFHGVVMFTTELAIRDWLLVVLYKLHNWCNIDIDTISDTSIWEKYCRKYDHITKIPPLQNGIEWSKKVEL